MASEVMGMTINDDEWFSSEREPRTDHEREFLRRVRDLSDGLGRFGVTKPDTQAWMFEDDDGIWMLLHVDLVTDHIEQALRIDYSDGRVLGGLSPDGLGWDAETRYSQCEVDMSDPRMWVVVATGSSSELGEIMAGWFLRHAEAFRSSPPRV
jgi:hypothetical protein